MLRIAAIGLAGLLASLAAGCAEPTQLVVVVSTDMTVPTELDSVRVQVVRVGETVPIHDQLLPLPAGSPSATGFQTLLSFGAGPRGDDTSRRIRVVVDAIKDGRTLFTTEVRTGFARRKRLRLDVYLARRCLTQAAMCVAGETCGLRGCTSPDVPVSALPLYTGDSPPTGVDPRGADGGSPDAGADAGGCVVGAPCPLGSPCELGTTRCDGPTPVCVTAGPAPATTNCRAATGPCDVPELCDGVSTTCPADALAAAAVVCRPAVDGCDTAERCDGARATCPADAFESAGVMCMSGATAGLCDGLGTCSTTCTPGAACGTGNACERGSMDCAGPMPSCVSAGPLAAGTSCRAAIDVCDSEETCDGATVTCPADSVLPSGTLCRASGGVCDRPEYCTGTDARCPGDGYAAAGTVCRAAFDACDLAETCSGVGAGCPADAFMAAGTACAGGTCTGASAACRTSCVDGMSCIVSGACRAGTCMAGICVDTGTMAGVGTVCRAAVGPCDVAEVCTGTFACPPNSFAAPGTSCGPSMFCNGAGACCDSMGGCI